MFQMRKEREVVTDLGPEARNVRPNNNLWLLGGWEGGCGSQSHGILGSGSWLTQQVVLHVLSALACGSQGL